MGNPTHDRPFSRRIHMRHGDVSSRLNGGCDACLAVQLNAIDDLVDDQFAKGSKRRLPALRDSIAFKVAYAYGLRRRELTMLEYVDFGPNPHVASYGGCPT
jgi:hypothetical protein